MSIKDTLKYWKETGVIFIDEDKKIQFHIKTKHEILVDLLKQL